MPTIHPSALDYERRRWLRPDAYRFIRHDWRRFVKRGSELEAYYESIERKYSADQPRVPAGNPDGGQWTGGGGGGGINDPRVISDATPDSERPGAQYAQNLSGIEGERTRAIPTDVVLPNGQKILDPKSPTGYLRSPTADLSEVARAGRKTGKTVRSLLGNKLLSNPFAAASFLALSLGRDLGHHGTFDFQRDGSTFLRDYINVSNFNVGLYTQQAGLSLNEMLLIAGTFSRLFSNNPKPRDSYGLTEEQRRFMELGHRAGQSGAFDSLP